MAANVSLSRFPGETAYYEVGYTDGGTPVDFSTGTLSVRLHSNRDKDVAAGYEFSVSGDGLTGRVWFSAAATDAMKVGKYLLYFFWSPPGADPAESSAIAVCELVIKNPLAE